MKSNTIITTTNTNNNTVGRKAIRQAKAAMAMVDTLSAALAPQGIKVIATKATANAEREAHKALVDAKAVKAERVAQAKADAEKAEAERLAKAEAKAARLADPSRHERIQAAKALRKQAEQARETIRQARKATRRLTDLQAKLAKQEANATTANLEGLKKAQTVARGKATKATNTYMAKAAKANEAEKKLSELRRTANKTFGQVRLNAMAEIEAMMPVADALRKDANEAYKAMMAAKQERTKAENRVATAKANEDRLRWAAEDVADAAADAAEAQAAVDAMTDVVVAYGDHTVVTTFATEEEARAYANKAFSGRGDSEVMVTIKATVSKEKLAKATSAKRDGIRCSEAFATWVSRNYPVRQGKDDLSTRGKYPEWLVVVEDGKGNLISSTEVADEAEGLALIEEANGDDMEAVLFHDMVAIHTTLSLASAKEELTPIKVVRLRHGRLVEDGWVAGKGGTLRWMEAHGETLVKYEAALKVPSEFAPEWVKQEYAVNRHAHEVIARKGVMLDGRRVGILGPTSPNAAKDCRLFLANVALIPACRAWQNANAQDAWMVLPSKFFAYNALPNAAITPWLEQFQTAAIKLVADLELAAQGTAVNVHKDGSHDEPSWREVVQKNTDGQAVMALSSKLIKAMMDAGADPAKLKDFVEMKSGTGRFSKLTKGSFVKLATDGLVKLAEAWGVTEIDGTPVEDIALLIAGSVYKGAFGESGSHADWENFVKNNDDVSSASERGTMLKTHGPNPEYKRGSTQLLRALTGLPFGSFNKLLDREKAYLVWLTTTLEGVASLFDKANAEAIKAHPELLQLPAYRDHAAKQLETIFAEARQGRFHNLVQNYQAATDIFAWLWKTMTGTVKQFIPAGVVIIPGKKLKAEGQKVVVTRSPIKGRSALQVVRCFSSFTAAGIEYGELFDSIVVPDGVCFVSTADLVMTALEMDFDGDHIQVIDDSLIVELVEELEAKYGKAVIVLSDLEKGDKMVITPKVAQDYLANLTNRVGVGSADNLKSKLCAMIPLGGELTAEFMEADWQQDRQIQAAVDTGKGAADTVVFVECPMLQAAHDMELPLALQYTQAERRGLPLPIDEEGNIRTDFDPSNMFDFIRLEMTAFCADLKLDLSFACQQKLDYRWFQLADAELVAPIYNLTQAPQYKWVRAGERNFSEVLFFDSIEEAQTARQAGYESGFGGFEVVYEGSKRDYVRRAPYACLHDEAGKALVLDTKLDLAHPLDGRWVANEKMTGLFMLLEQRMRDEWDTMLETEDSSQRKLAREFRANKALLARKAIAGYAALYGFTLHDAYNRIVEMLFTVRDEEANWVPNWFAYQWFFNVFHKEFVEALQEGGVDVEEMEYIDDDDSMLDDRDDCISEEDLSID